MSASRALEERIRAALAVIVDTTPVGNDLGDLQERANARSRSYRLSPLRTFAAAFVSVVLVGGLLLWLAPEGPSDSENIALPAPSSASSLSENGGGAPEPTGGDEEVEFVEARYEVALAGECAATNQGFPSATIRIWGPAADGNYRVELEYPDGSSESLVTDSLVNVEPRKIWYGKTGNQQIGDKLARSDCLDAGATSPNAAFERVVLLQAALLVSADNLVTADGASIADGLLEQEPTRVETVVDVPSNVYVFPGLRTQSIWLDPEARRVQKRATEVVDAAGATVVSETITVLARGRTRVESAWFDGSQLPLYSSTAGAGG